MCTWLLPPGVNIIARSGWLVCLDIMLIVISWKVHVQLSWNVAQVFTSVQRLTINFERSGESSGSNPPYWKSSNYNIKLSSLRDTGLAEVILAWSVTLHKIQDGILLEVWVLSNLSLWLLLDLQHVHSIVELLVGLYRISALAGLESGPFSSSKGAITSKIKLKSCKTCTTVAALISILF